jgi:subtilisin-like proprotein convertase family protein
LVTKHINDWYNVCFTYVRIIFYVDIKINVMINSLKSSTYDYNINTLKFSLKFIVMQFQSYSFLKHKKMKNYFTIFTFFLMVVVFPNQQVIGSTDHKGGHLSWVHQYDDCFVLSKRVALSSLMSWQVASSAMMPCPMVPNVQLGFGECGREVDFQFTFPDITVSNLLFSQNNNQGAIDGTIFCDSGQTIYRRTFNHSGPTDLSITSVNLGVFESVNDPLVTINFYNGAGTILYGSYIATIPDLNNAVYSVAIPAGIKVPRQSTFITEIVANAPYLSVFKIGRNNGGNSTVNATVISADCAPNELIVEGPIGTPVSNSIVFGVVGTPDDYYYDNLNDNYESGDFFPIGSHVMSYIVTDANNSSTACAFNVNVLEFANITGAIACNDLVNVSLDGDCEAVVTPDMLLEGNEYGCYDDFTVQITAINGANLGNRVTKANIGQTLKVQIISSAGNSCWGEILVEDKFGPEFICEDIYATCSTDLRPGSLLSPRVPVSARILDKNIPAIGVKTISIPVADLQGTTITDLNVFLDITHGRISDLGANITSPDGITVPLFFSSACDGSNLMITLDDEAAASHDDLQEVCELTDPTLSGVFKPANPLSIFDGAPLEGEWVINIYDFEPGEAGTVNNVDIIFSQTGGRIPFPTPNPVTFVYVADNTYIVNGIDACSAATVSYTDTVIEEDCNSIYSKVIRRCWVGTDAKGNQGDPCCQTIYVYRNGLSTLQFPLNYDGLPGNNPALSCLDYGDVIPSVNVTGLPSGDLCYNVQIVDPVDVKIDLCGNSYKLIRTHKVIEWCSGQVILHNQIIKVLDDQGPELDCPNDVTISADDYACSATYVVPKPVILDECSYLLEYQLSYAPINDFEEIFVTTGVNQVTGTIAALPLGENWVKWTVTDECGNVSECYYLVDVVDNVRPTAVCDQYSVVSITGNGKAIVDAITFDDGSFDNCGILKIDARKMTDKCGFGTLLFTPKLEFCCEEVNTTIMVEFRVTDLSGNSNTCMVEISVQDKLPPYITVCPPDITLDCQADYKDLSITKEPVSVDNCGVISTKYQDQVNINSCGVGTVTRTWTVEDKQGYKHSCVQVITLLNDDPFYYNINNPNDPKNDIVWPENYETKKCFSLLTPHDLPVGFDKPRFNDDNCSLVASHYKDQVFKFVDGACEKILRTWTVIDWCTYNDLNPVYGQGWYEHVQIIKLQNDIPPQFIGPSGTILDGCVDRTFGSYGNCEERIIFIMTAIDDCPEDNTNLVWKYELDLFDNGTIDAIVNSDRFDRVLKNGRHKIKWTVEDKCGNRAFCTHYINVVDYKKPTPYCISSITTAVMNSNGKIAIWAADYDLGSFDNCTPTEDLLFTFYGATPVKSMLNVEHYFKGQGVLATKAEYEAGNAQIWIPTLNTSGIIFGCEDIPNGISQEISIEMWVTDLAGNQDYCTVTLVLQDNANVCPDSNGNQIAISGRAAIGNSLAMTGCDVNLVSSLPEHSKTAKTDASGAYNFAQLPKNNNYTVSMSDNRNILNGVSTLDLVLTQRHILGIDVFSDPLKVIAADVDNNTKVTAADLVALRKVILGINSEFPNNQKSWRFVTSNHVFTNPLAPFPFTESYVYNQLNAFKVNQNFIGVKIGDINGSATANIGGSSVESRSNTVLTFEVEPVTATEGQYFEVPVYANEFENIFGFQHTLTFDVSKMELINIASGALNINESNFGTHRLSEGLLTASWNEDKPVSVISTEPLFTLKFKANAAINHAQVLQMVSDVTPAMAFDNDQKVLQTKLNVRSVRHDGAYTLMQNKPNPFTDKTSISFTLPENGQAILKVFDLTGKTIKVVSGDYSKGENTIELMKSELGTSVVLMYQLESGTYTETKKMIILE